MREFLSASDVIDHDHPAVRSLAAELAGDRDPVDVAAHCFRWVRDNIRHSLDCGDDAVTLAASDVLRHGTGLCYAKSHLLAALLRANGVACGFVYQRLAMDDDGRSFCLHGLNAVWLADQGWYRIDPRGNRDAIHADFDPPREKLAFATALPGERTIDGVFADPLPVVVSALQRFANMREMAENLPDWTQA